MQFRTVYMTGIHYELAYFILLFWTLIYCSAYPKPSFKRNFLILLNICAVILSVAFTVYPLYRYVSGKYSVAEGVVEDFYAQPPGGHGMDEHFVVDGQYFEYSNYTITYGYRRPRCFGGVVTGNGQYLRICYITSGKGDNRIIKMEEAIQK